MNPYVTTVPLKYLIHSQKGTKPLVLVSSPTEDYSVPYLDINSLETGIIKEYTNQNLGSISSSNDILMVWDGSRSGLALRGTYGVVGSTLMCLTPLGLDKEFLYYFLKSKFNYLNKNTTGISIPHVNSEIFFELEIPYCSIKCQKEIVKKIESKLQGSLSIINAQEEAIRKTYNSDSIPKNLEPNKIIDFSIESIIEAAVSGKLNSSANGNTFNSTSQLPNWQIPQKWNFVSVGSVVENFQYGTSNKSENFGLVPVLRMGNIKDNKIIWEDLKYSNDQNDISKYKLNVGDVLFNRTNSPELVGKTAVFDGNRDAIFAGYLIRLKLHNAKINPYYLMYCLNSRFARSYYLKVMVGSANQANVNAKKLAEFKIPLPSLTEQLEIVTKVNKLLTISNQLKKDYEKAKKLLTKLEESIISEAFEFNRDSIEKAFDKTAFIEELISNKEQFEGDKKEALKKMAKNKSFYKESLITPSNIDIEELLKEGPKEAKLIWENSKYKDDIDNFYQALKEKNERSIKFEIKNIDQNVPNSIIELITTKNED